MSEVLRRLPKVDRVLDHPELAALALDRGFARRAAVAAIEAERARVRAALDADPSATPEVPGLDAFVTRLVAELEALLRDHPRRVLNGTGVLLHTNLGRAVLSAEARAAVVEAGGNCALELDLATGKRGSRMALLRPLLAHLFEAEDVHVVNNGAAALLLACTALASCSDPASPGGIVLSRGQHVEIGDSFRVAEMAAAGGVPLIPVGSTNRTHLRDYAAALDAQPGALILWVHQSNFVQSGFVRQVSLAQLAALARERRVPLVADLGSGSLGRGIPTGEPTVAAYLGEGASIVSFSGDKLLGGPQAGLLAGEAEVVARCRRDPLARALRCGKLALAALHTTAATHARAGGPALPLHQMLAVELDVLRERGERIAAALGWPLDCVRDSRATIGGGSLPGEDIASVALVAPGPATKLAAQLRAGEPALLGRVRDGQLWIDLRSLALEPDDDLLAALG